MKTPGPLARWSVLGWSFALGVLFVLGYEAVAVLGTKSSHTFQYVSPPRRAKPATSPAPSTISRRPWRSTPRTRWRSMDGASPESTPAT